MLGREYGQNCSVARTLELIGERWTMLVIRDVFSGRRRFDQIQESLGVARNVLASRLQLLIDEGILEKRAYQERPQRYEYFLTEKGLDLWPILIALIGFGDRHLSRRRRAAAPDPPQGLRRPRQRPPHLRALRQGAHGARGVRRPGSRRDGAGGVAKASPLT